MNSLIEELKYNFKRKDNGLIKIILINIIVFIAVSIVFVISKISQNLLVYHIIEENIHLPSQFQVFLTRPWTLITYFFNHADIFHILFNMLGLYWFGNLIVEYLGNRRLVNLYLLGGLAGGLFFLLLFNLVPFFREMHASGSGLIGASGAVFAVVIGAATLLPDYSFFLIFFGPVKIKYIAWLFVFVSFIGSVQENAGGNVAHLGGALLGFIFIKQLKRGNDIGKPISKTGDFFSKVFYKKPEMKISHKGKAQEAKYETPDQKEIDAILDKINRSGYESLSREEKQKLFKASQK
jgi:membrane associated rhomboid family serine protease